MDGYDIGAKRERFVAPRDIVDGPRYDTRLVRPTLVPALAGFARRLLGLRAGLARRQSRDA